MISLWLVINNNLVLPVNVNWCLLFPLKWKKKLNQSWAWEKFLIHIAHLAPFSHRILYWETEILVTLRDNVVHFHYCPTAVSIFIVLPNIHLTLNWDTNPLIVLLSILISSSWVAKNSCKFNLPLPTSK